MAQKILQVNFKFSMSTAEYEQTFLPAAPSLASTPGLRWKVWIVNEQDSEAGGIYLFDDETTLHAFVNGPIVAALTRDPNFSDWGVKTFDILEPLTLITRGPIQTVAQT